MSGLSAQVWTPGKELVPLVNSNSLLIPEAFVAIEGQQIFNITRFQYVPNVGATLVFINGVLQLYGADYSETSATSIQLQEGVHAGDLVVVYGFVGITASVTILQGNVTTFNTRTGAVILNQADVLTALGYTPLQVGRTAVVNPVLQNGWADAPGGNLRVGYWKDYNGIVHLEGCMQGGSLVFAAFTLDVGFRPVNALYFPSYGNVGAVKSTIIGADGQVYMTGNDNTFASFDGVSFRTT